LPPNISLLLTPHLLEEEKFDALTQAKMTLQAWPEHVFWRMDSLVKYFPDSQPLAEY
jgi:hypothetical protein